MSFGGGFDLGSAAGSIRLDADLRGIETAKKALVDFQKQSATTSAAVQRNFADLASSMRKIGAGMSLAITAPLVLAGRQAITAASDLVEAQTAVNTIFGQGAEQIQAFAATSAQALGLSRTAALSAATGFAGMGRAAGLANTELADFSEQLVINAADLASFFNQDPGAMLDRLRSGLAGEAEPLRQFGIDLTEANVALKAAQMGLGDVTGELTQQEKVLARYAVIQEEIGAAMGDRARTAGQFAGSLRTLQASMADLAAELGQELLPFMLSAVTALTAAARAFGDLPQPVRTATVAIAAILAVVGPAAVAVGLLAAAIVGLNTATIAGTPALVALAAAAAPLAAIVVGGAAVGLLAKGIIDAKQASEEATDPVNTLTEAIERMTVAAREAAEVQTAQELANQWKAAADQINATAQAADDAARQELAVSGGDPMTGALDAQTAAIATGNVALAERIKLNDQYRLTNERSAAIEQALARILAETGDEFIADARAARTAIADLQAHNKTADETVQILNDLANASQSSALGLGAVGSAANTAEQGTARARGMLADYQQLLAQRGPTFFEKVTADAREAAQATTDARLRAEEFFAAARAAASDVAFQQTPAAQLVGLGEQTPQEAQANADALNRASEERTQVLADNAIRRKELERDYVAEVERINRDLTDTLRDLDGQREQNTRDMHRSLVELEQSTAQQTRQLEAQRVQAVQQANDQLATIAAQRAENAANLQEGLADAQEAATEQFADLAERRVEIQADAHERMVDAEEQATEALAALAERRQQIEQDTAEAMADSREQASEALADLAERQVDIQETLRESLLNAQEQYNETLADLAEAQGEVRQNLAEQLQDLTDAWKQQEADLSDARKEILADLRASLRELDAAWATVNDKNLRAQQTLRAEIGDTLRQNALTAKQLQADLKRVQGDETFTEDEKAEAAFRTARALEGLALDRELAERDAARTIADLEEERQNQQREYEAERRTAVQQAERDLRTLNRQRMEAEKAYHDRRIELEQDASDRITDLNEQRSEAAQQLAEAEAEAHETANEQFADLAEQRTEIAQEAAERESDIRQQSAEQSQDLAAQQLAIEQDLAEKRKDIRQQLADQTADIAEQEADIAENLAKQQQDLREQAAEREQALAEQEQQIHEDLAQRLAEIEQQKELVLRDAARERGVILREAANEAAQIAQEQAAAENAAVRAGLEAQRELRKTMLAEDLLTVAQQGTDRGVAFIEAEIAGLKSKAGELQTASAELAAEVVTGALSVLGELRTLGQNLGDALVGGLNAAKVKAQEAGKAVAAAAEKGAKKEAEIASPSRRWRALGFNMGTSLAMGQRDALLLNEDAARQNVRRAAKAASEEFKRRRVNDASWSTVAEQGRRHQQRGLAMARDGRMAGLGAQTIHVTLEMDGRVLEEKIIRVGIGGLRGALQRNPSHRRRA